jgi:hypothetical protein
MSRRLLIVTDRFSIRGRGLVATPGFLPLVHEQFRAGDPLLLKRADGTVVHATIASLRVDDRSPSHEVVLMLKDLTREDVPIGTEVWSVDGGSAA